MCPQARGADTETVPEFTDLTRFSNGHEDLCQTEPGVTAFERAQTENHGKETGTKQELVGAHIKDKTIKIYFKEGEMP